MIVRTDLNTQVDLNALLKHFKELYKNIYIFQFEEQVFIYRSIGRKEYKDLILNENLTEQDKEEYLCSLCTLYPPEYDFSNCEEAGLPTRLADEIQKNSYLSAESRENVLNYHRQEMYDLDNQINCIILAAFPHLTLEEIENWDVVTACKYLSRSEWILHNINGVPLREKDQKSAYMSVKETARTSEVLPDDKLKSSAPNKDVAHNGKLKNKKTQLTPEKLRELKAKYPDIPWEEDMGQYGVEGITEQQTVDTTALPNLKMRELRAMRKNRPPAGQ